MAGSKKWFVYTTDFGDNFAIELDESNTEAVNGEVSDFTNNLTFKYGLPRNITPRTVPYRSQDGKRTVSCVCLTQQIYNGVLNGVSTIPDPLTSGQTLYIATPKPEKIRLPKGVDTGLDDGDAT